MVVKSNNAPAEKMLAAILYRIWCGVQLFDGDSSFSHNHFRGLCLFRPFPSLFHRTSLVSPPVATPFLPSLTFCEEITKKELVCIRTLGEDKDPSFCPSLHNRRAVTRLSSQMSYYQQPEQWEDASDAESCE
jgi:hypothetical protein